MDLGSQEQWARVEGLFADALDLAPAARAAYLEATCSGDHEVRAQLERLLAAHEASSGFLASLDTTSVAALLRHSTEAESPPELVGDYRIVRRLGGGGMGVVYLAHDPRLDRPVALKLLRRRFGLDDLRSRRLLDEARAASALDHPHVAPVYEVGETPDGLLYIAMAYCEGESLADRLSRGALSPHEAAEITRQIADALAAAHRRGIVHRDVKPANIIISESRGARLVDFGIAKVSGRESGPARGVVGTVAYMSPEQTSGVEADHLTDVWALGVVLYEMLTGRRPFRGESDAALLRAIRNDPPAPVRQVRPDAPTALARIAERCLEKRPSERPPGAAAVAAELHDFLTRSAFVSGRERLRSRRTSVTLGALGVVLTIASGAWILSSRTRAVPSTDDAAALVVLPFAPMAGDTALKRFGRELVVTIAGNLDGVGGVRVVDPISVLGQLDTSSILEVGRAAEVARRLGAGRMIHGRLTRVGSRMRLDATVYETGSLGVLARASAGASTGDIAALTDSITIELLRTAWAGRGGPAPNPTALRTASLPALRAYLDGELAMAGGRFRTAQQSFKRAMDADSTFWFAYWRYAYARSYHGQPVDSAVTAAIRAHSSGFPEQDRLLVEARMVRGQRTRLARRREITERYPSYWPAWFELGDQLTHHGGFLGVSADEGRAALERTVELNPRFVPAWEHLLWISLLIGDTATTGKVLAKLTVLRIDSLAGDEWDLDKLDYYRYLDHLARSGGEPRAAEAEIGVRVLSSASAPPQPERHATSLSDYGFFRAQLDLSSRLRSHGAPAATFTAHAWGEALAWAGRGAWDSALVAARLYSRTTSNPGGALWAFGLATAGAWVGVLPSESAVALRQAASLSEGGRTSAGRAELAWLDGLLACVRNDSAALRAQRDLLAASTVESAPALGRSLAAFESAMTGRREESARSLAALEWEGADAGWAFRHGSLHPFLIAINRLASGRWLLSAGDTAEATRLLLFREPDLPVALHPLSTVNRILGTLALRELSRSELAQGAVQLARHHQQLFRQRSDLSPPDWNPLSEPWICGRRQR